jgi:hypothetical protein
MQTVGGSQVEEFTVGELVLAGEVWDDLLVSPWWQDCLR